MTISKPVFTFNHYFYDLIKAVKEEAPELKDRIRANYKVKNVASIENVERFGAALAAVPGARAAIVAGGEEALQHEDVAQLQLLKDVAVKDITAAAKPEFLRPLASFVYVLTLLHTLVGIDGADGAALFDKSVEVLSLVQQGKPFQQLLDDIFDDDVRALLMSINAVSAHAKAESAPDASQSLPFLEGTKIGALAKEISNDIDLSGIDVNTANPADLLSNQGLLGDIVTKVGSKISAKMSSGELKHEELLSEAMGMLNMFGKSGAGAGIFNNPMFAELAKAAAGAAGGGGGGGKARAQVNTSKLRTMSARDRLRRKHEERQKAGSSGSSSSKKE